MTSAHSGRPVEELTLDRVLLGELDADDVRISAAALRRQAERAEARGNPQLAENLLRAAELTAFADDEVLALYEALRPRRRTAAQLGALAAELEDRGAVRCAALVAEAAAAYARRGLLR